VSIYPEMVEVKQTTVLTHTEDIPAVCGWVLALQPDNNYIRCIVQKIKLSNFCFLVKPFSRNQKLWC